jgi:hypothetical protein
MLLIHNPQFGLNILILFILIIKKIIKSYKLRTIVIKIYNDYQIVKNDLS